MQKHEPLKSYQIIYILHNITMVQDVVMASLLYFFSNTGAKHRIHFIKIE